MRPSPRCAMSRATCLARWTVEHVEIHDAQLVMEVRPAGEGAARADPGVQRDCVGRPSRVLHPAVQLVDALVGAEVDLDGLDGGAEPFELADGVLQLRVLGSDDEVELVGGELLGQLAPDPGRRAGDDRQRAGCGRGHGAPVPAQAAA